MDPADYPERIRRWQVKLRRRVTALMDTRRSALAVFEGWDAAGKGGAIKRVTETLDPRSFAVHSFGKPVGDEATHHYLWRFWKSIPDPGQLAVFDRSHYGRVLVERVEGFCPAEAWKRAYREINEFEAQLVSAGIVVVKYWLHIDPDEQLRRFESRELDPFRKYKLTDEDWRNRARWQEYLAAVEEMIEHTSTAWAPWTVVEANDKFHARMKVVRTLARALASR
jgi:polyphosphate kinase 2 (PPK2 family)